MDHLKWDSEVYEAYISSLQKMNRRLDEELQTLAAARQGLLSQNADGSDEALNQIQLALEKTVKGITDANDRVYQVREALSDSMDLFMAAERKNSSMDLDMLYSGAVSSSASSVQYPLYTPYSSGLSGDVTPGWLLSLADAG
ncbi:MAG: hypothetical protein IKN04_00120 [Clostridia bacterium]|nr:hypothetical protein [Clostridia bacterium]